MLPLDIDGLNEVGEGVLVQPVSVQKDVGDLLATKNKQNTLIDKCGNYILASFCIFCFTEILLGIVYINSVKIDQG